MTEAEVDLLLNLEPENKDMMKKDLSAVRMAMSEGLGCGATFILELPVSTCQILAA